MCDTIDIEVRGGKRRGSNEDLNPAQPDLQMPSGSALERYEPVNQNPESQERAEKVPAEDARRALYLRQTATGGELSSDRLVANPFATTRISQTPRRLSPRRLL